MSIIAIVNQKGGCGKTTTAINLSASLNRRGNKVLLIDLDAQAHASLGLGIESHNSDKTIYEVLTNRGEFKISDVIRNTPLSGLDIVPSNILLSGAEVDLVNVIGRESILRECLNEIKVSYDYIFIDCSPSLSLLAVNALASADSVLIPLQTHYYALEGMKQLFNTVDIVKKRINSELCILGILLTFFDRRTNISKEILRGVRDYFKEKVFKTVININVKLTEAPSAGKPVISYAPNSRGAHDYMELADEVIEIGRRKEEDRTQ